MRWILLSLFAVAVLIAASEAKATDRVLVQDGYGNVVAVQQRQFVVQRQRFVRAPQRVFVRQRFVDRGFRGIEIHRRGLFNSRRLSIRF